MPRTLGHCLSLWQHQALFSSFKQALSYVLGCCCMPPLPTSWYVPLPRPPNAHESHAPVLYMLPKESDLKNRCIVVEQLHILVSTLIETRIEASVSVLRERRVPIICMKFCRIWSSLFLVRPKSQMENWSRDRLDVCKVLKGSTVTNLHQSCIAAEPFVAMATPCSRPALRKSSTPRESVEPPPAGEDHVLRCPVSQLVFQCTGLQAPRTLSCCARCIATGALTQVRNDLCLGIVLPRTQHHRI